MNEIPRKKIVVTGCCGFIGKILVPALRGLGHEVFGIDAAPGDGFHRADFLDAGETKRAFESIGPFDILLHLAAIAHHQKIAGPFDESSVNVEILENVLAAAIGFSHLIFFSSVAVYGEEGRTALVPASSDLRPSSRYGQGKKRCEERILRTPPAPFVDILRPAPVYDPEHMNDLAKRVYVPLPGMKAVVKMAMYPSPSYSFCHVETLRDRVIGCIAAPHAGLRTINVADPVPLSQRELARKFPGMPVPVVVPLLSPVYYLLKAVPGRTSCKIRSLYRKLFSDNVYDLEPFEIQR